MINDETPGIEYPPSGSRSTSIGQLVTALAAAQLQFDRLGKGTENPFFHSKYADLSQVIAATRKGLADNGLVIIQTPIVRDKSAGVLSVLAHKSGEWIQNELLLPAGVTKFDAQTVGSAITYARRYSYQALVGIAAEVDDDANGATENTGSKEAAQAVAQRKIAEHKASPKANGPQPSTPSVSAAIIEFSIDERFPGCAVLSGKEGIALLRSNHEIPALVYMDISKVWLLPNENVIEVARLCEALHIHVTGTAAVYQAKDSDLPDSFFPVIHGVQAKSKGTKKWLSVNWGNEPDLACWDIALWPFLTDGQGQTADLELDAGTKINPKTNKPYYHIKGIRRIGDRTFTDNIPDRLTSDIGPSKV